MTPTQPPPCPFTLVRHDTAKREILRTLRVLKDDNVDGGGDAT